MKKMVFVSENRVLIERLTAMVCERADLELQLLSTTRITEAWNDIVAFKANIVLVDMILTDRSEKVLELRNKVYSSESIKKCILLVDEDNLNLEDVYPNEYVIGDKHLDRILNELVEYRVV